MVASVGLAEAGEVLLVLLYRIYIIHSNIYLRRGREKVRQEEARNMVSVTASRIINLGRIEDLYETGQKPAPVQSKTRHLSCLTF